MFRILTLCTWLFFRLARGAQQNCMPRTWVFEGNALAWTPVNGNVWYTKLHSSASFYEQVNQCASIEPGKTSIGRVFTQAEQTAVSLNYNNFAYNHQVDNNNEEIDFSNVNKFGPYAVKNEFTKRFTKTFLNRRQLELVKSCGSKTEISTDVKLRVIRDDSHHASKVTYFRFDTNKIEEFIFTGGYTDHTRIEYDGKSLVCMASKVNPQCNQLPRGTRVPGVVISVDLNPRAGKASGNQWDRRNLYSVSGSYVKVACKSQGVYLGGFELGNTGRWMWWPGLNNNGSIGGMTTGYWATGQPSKDDVVGHCVQTTKRGWVAVPCSSKGKAVCELRC